MCVNCVAQGGVYLGGAVGAMQVMAHRARQRRLVQDAPEQPDVDADLVDASAPTE